MSKRQAIIFIILVFLVTRGLLFLLEKDLFLYKFPYQDDAPAYLKISQILLGQESYESSSLSPFVRVPGYPLFLSAIQKPAGLNNFKTIFFIQQFISLVIIFTLFFYLCKKTSIKMALTLVLILALFFDFTLYGFLIRSEILFTFLIFFGTLTHLNTVNRRQLKWAVLTGLLFGLATLTRPVSFLAFIPLSLTILATKQKGLNTIVSSLKLIFAFLIPFVLVLTPWLTRNYSLSGRFLLQQDLSNIYYATLPGGHWQSVQITDVIDTADKDYLAIDSEMTALAVKNIKEKPNVWIKNSLRSFLYRLWSMGFTDTYLRYFEYTPDTGGYHKSSISPLSKLISSINIFSNRYSINPIHHLYLVINNIIGFSFILMSLFCLIVFPYFKRNAIVIFTIFLYFWSITSIFAFSGSRYMIPMVPLLFLLTPDILAGARSLFSPQKESLSYHSFIKRSLLKPFS